MKYTVSGFNQAHLVTLGLSLIDAEILRWFVDFQGTGRMREFSREDGRRFYMVSYKAVISDLPTIEINSTDSIARRFRKLAEAGALEHYHATVGGSFSCYRLGPQYLALTSDSISDPPTLESHPSDVKVGPPPTQKSEQKTHLPITHLPDTQEAGAAPEKTRYRDADIDAFVKKWNAEGLPEYRRVPVLLVAFPQAGEVVEALSFYTPDEILSAIGAYAQVVKNRADYTWGATYPTPASFFIKGVPVFCPGSRPLEVLRKASPKDSKPTLSAVAGPLVCSHCGERKAAHYCTNGNCPVNNEDGLTLTWVTPEVYQNGRAV